MVAPPQVWQTSCFGVDLKAWFYSKNRDLSDRDGLSIDLLGKCSSVTNFNLIITLQIQVNVKIDI